MVCCLFFEHGAIPLFLAAEVGNSAVCRELLGSYAEQQLNMGRKVQLISVVCLLSV